MPYPLWPTITAEPLPASGGIRVTISTALNVDSLIRADVNGTAPVRTRPNGLEVPGGGADIILTDYEPGEGPVTYTVRTLGGVRSVSVNFALEGPWLFVPILPNYSARLKAVLTYSATAPGRSTVHEPLNRARPTVVIRDMGSRRGSLGLYGGTYEDAQAILDALARGEVLMLRQPEHRHMDMYFIATGAEINILQTAEAGTLFGVIVEYIEVDRPTGDLAGALGWTFASVAAAAPDFATITATYASFEALRLNETA